MNSIIKLFTLLIFSCSYSIAQSEQHYNFIQPFMITLDKNKKESEQTQKQLLEKFKNIAKVAPQSVEFQDLNYKIMQNFQYQYYQIAIKKSINTTKNYRLETEKFIKILKSIKKPSFFTLYSQLYLETLAIKHLQDKDVIALNALANQKENPYAQLLSYIDSLNQINTVLLTDQKNLYKQLALLLDRLPEKQQSYLLRLTALKLLPLYSKESTENKFNKLFAENKIIKREQILESLNFQDANTFEKYTKKDKQRSFLDQIVFKANMAALKRNDVAKILATLYMQENNFTQARSYIRQAPRENLESQYNPFNSSIDINNSVKYRKKHSIRSFAEVMERLEKRLEKESATARDFYLYGNGLYNKSWFGNFPMSSVFKHNPKIYKNLPLPPTTNLNKAKEAYLSALKKIETRHLEGKKKEKGENFKAEVAYQLLKIEFNMALINSKNYPKYIKSMPTIGAKYNGTKNVQYLLKKSRSFTEAIKDYKADYSHTSYGKRVIKKSIIFELPLLAPLQISRKPSL